MTIWWRARQQANVLEVHFCVYVIICLFIAQFHRSVNSIDATSTFSCPKAVYLWSTETKETKPVSTWYEFHYVQMHTNTSGRSGGGGVRGITPPPSGFFACQFEHSYGPAFSGTLNTPPPFGFIFCLPWTPRILNPQLNTVGLLNAQYKFIRQNIYWHQCLSSHNWWETVYIPKRRSISHDTRPNTLAKCNTDGLHKKQWSAGIRCCFGW